VGFCERDAYAAAVLLARMEDAALEPAPVWCGNLEDADWSQWRGSVDCVAAGFPCPPVSVAGKRQGTEDARWILPAIMRCVREVGAEWVFLENVGGLLSANAGREFGEVLRLLAESGFDAEWLVLPASDVGAPHERERVFFLAHAVRLPSRQRPGWKRVLDDGSEVADAEGQRTDARDRSSGGGASLAKPSARGPELEHAAGDGRIERRTESDGRGVASGCGELADSARIRREERQDARADSGDAAVEESGTDIQSNIFPPGPSEVLAWRRVVEDGSGDFRAPAIEPGLRVLAHGLALVVDQSRADQLRCGGNGVVALQAAVAFVVLGRRWGMNCGSQNTR